MVLSTDPVFMIENHGAWYYEMQELGYNYRMPDVLLCTGDFLRLIECLMLKCSGGRNSPGLRYHRAFLRGTRVKSADPMKNGLHAYLSFLLSRLKTETELYEHLKANNTDVGVHFIPMHLMPYYKNLGFKKGNIRLRNLIINIA